MLKGKQGNEIDEVLIPYHLETTGSWDGKEYKISPKWQNDFMYDFMPESKFKNSTWYDFVDEHIAKTVKHKIQYNSPVNAIDYAGNTIIVKTKNGNTFEADRVLVTVSIGVLKSNMISFTPEMDTEKKKAINAINFRPGFKVLMKFSEQFYPNAISCEVENGEKVFYDIAFKKEAQSNILGFLCVGDETQSYYDINAEQKIISSLL